MQTYLQSGDLKLLELQNFDSWIGMFAEAKTDFEIDVDTSGYRVCTRLSRFHNLPELTNLFSAVAHYHQERRSDDLPDFEGYTDCVLTKTKALYEYLSQISERAEAVRGGKVRQTDDNMLKITGDGRKAALDIRLVMPEKSMEPDSKVFRCAQNIVNVYNSDPEHLCTQLVFCDISTPKEGFNVYDDLKRLLIAMGIPAGEIEFIHSADDSEAKRNVIFKRVNSGEIRVLLGSTAKLGTGVNVQTHLKAIHHLDVPWRPADMVQREGRIIRPGNLNKSVKIYRYITHGSFDAYSWQLLQKKQEFISQMLDGSVAQRSGGEISDSVLNYAEVKALAVENPLIKERVEVSNELMKFVILQKQTAARYERLRARLKSIPAEKERVTKAMGVINDDWKFVQANPLPPEETRARKEAGKQKRRELRDVIANTVSMSLFSREERFICDYRGFKLSVPPNVSDKRLLITLERSGRYYIELGESENGYPIRVDNYIDGLYKQGEKQAAILADLIKEEAEARAELNKNESYTEQIQHYTSRLEEIDRQMDISIKK